MQLSLRRQMETIAQRIDAGSLQEIQRISSITNEQSEWINELEVENTRLSTEAHDLKARLGALEEEASYRKYEIEALKDQLSSAGIGRATKVDIDEILRVASRNNPPTPLECLNLIESLFGDRCSVLDSAKRSAEQMQSFVEGRQLLDMLSRLVNEFRQRIMSGGDVEARKVFGKNEYAAKESETVMSSRAMRRLRVFSYNGEDVEMFRHLKIGVGDDTSKTIRVHFFWDSQKSKVVIGYCGEHLPIASH